MSLRRPCRVQITAHTTTQFAVLDFTRRDVRLLCGGMGRQGVWSKVRGCFYCRCCWTDLYDGPGFFCLLGASVPAASLLMASTGLFNSKICCSTGPSPGSSVSPLRSSRGGASRPCPRLGSFAATCRVCACPLDAALLVYAFPLVEAP